MESYTPESIPAESETAAEPSFTAAPAPEPFDPIVGTGTFFGLEFLPISAVYKFFHVRDVRKHGADDAGCHLQRIFLQAGGHINGGNRCGDV